MWPNDILALFAQLGVLLLLIRRVSNRVLFVIGIACLFAAPAHYYISTGFADFRATDEQPRIETQHADDRVELETERIRSEGSYGEVVRWTAGNFLDWQTDLRTRLVMLREEFLMFLLGLYIGRRRMFERVVEETEIHSANNSVCTRCRPPGHPVISSLAEWATHPDNGHLAITFRQALLAVLAAAFSLFYDSLF